MPAVTSVVPDGQPASGKSSLKLQGIQYLRGLTALMVAYFHLCGQIGDYTAVLSGPAWFDVNRLAGSVDIFFVISGFIMVLTSQHMGIGTFLWRRLVRVVPLYWILTLVVALIAVVAPAVFKSTHFSVSGLVRSLLFIPYQNADQGGEVVPLLFPGWTLNLEMYFYLIFALTLLPLLRSGQILILSIFFCGMVMLRLFEISTAPLFLFYSDPRILEFLAGAWLGRLALDNRIGMPVIPAIALCAVGFVVLLSGVFAGRVAVALPPAAIVLALLCIERAGALPDMPWLGRLGDASYSIYLTHIFTLGAVRELWKHLHPGEGALYAWAFAALAMLAVVLVALLSYRCIEQPAMRLLSRRGQRQRKGSLATAPAP